MAKVAGRGCFVLGESRSPKFCQYDYGNFLSQLSCFLRLLKTAKITFLLLDFGIRIPFIMCMFHSSSSEDINRGLTMDNRFIECTVHCVLMVHTKVTMFYEASLYRGWIKCSLKMYAYLLDMVQHHTSTNMYRAFNIRLARFSWN